MDRKQERFLRAALVDKKHNLLKWVKNSTRVDWFKTPKHPEKLELAVIRVLYLNWCFENSDVDISPSKLSELLGKDHKFIDRYANYGNPFYPDASKGKDETWFHILDYLMVLEGEKPRQYAEYVFDEEDLWLMGFDRCDCFYVTEDGKTRLKYIDDGWEKSDYEDEDDDYGYEYIDIGPQCEEIAACIKQYSPEAQEYILKHIGMFWYISPEELTFIRRNKGLNQADREKLRAKMESYPISMEFMQANGMVRVGDTPIWAYLINEFMTNTYYFVYTNMQLYAKFLRNPKNRIGGYQEKVEREEETIAEEMIDDISHFVETLINKRHFDRYDVENQEGVKFTHREQEFPGILAEILAYTKEDWYMLYLLSRIQVMDFVNPGEQMSHVIMDHYHIGKREFEVWNFLDELEGK